MTPHIKTSARKKKEKNRIVTAVVVTHSDFSQLLGLQNLLNYLIECLTSIFSKIEFSEKLLQHIRLCLDHITRLKTSDFHCVEEELKMMIEKFIEKFNDFYKEIESIKSEEIDKHPLLYGKATELQWHAVCLREELKRYLFNNETLS